VSGDWVFVVTDRAQLLAVARSSGRIRWISQLPRYRDAEDRTGPIYWRGPILAGNRLVLAGSNGDIIFASPVDGSVQTTVRHREAMSLPPIVSNGTLIILDDSGRLTAWR
jgi:outer membrane protein assembly factor BamB